MVTTVATKNKLDSNWFCVPGVVQAERAVAISQSDVDKLERTIVSGEEEVQDGRRRVKHRSVDDLLKVRELAKGEVAAASGKRIRRFKVALK